jgi:hypothetical protein
VRKLILFAVIGIIGVIVLNSLNEPRTPPAITTVKQSEPPKGFCESPKPTYTAIPGAKPLIRRPAEQVFAEAAKISDEWFGRPGGLKAVPETRVQALRQQLESFHGEPACPRAETALHQVRNIEDAALRAQRELEEEQRIGNDSAGRKRFAEELESRFLTEWRDAKFRVSGDKNTVLTMTYVLVSCPFVHNLSNDGKFLAGAKKNRCSSTRIIDAIRSTGANTLDAISSALNQRGKRGGPTPTASRLRLALNHYTVS